MYNNIVYVISVKRIRYNNKLIPKDEQEYVYADIDNHSGSMSTGYPYWDPFCDGKHFSSIEAAEKWFYENNQYLGIETNNYDWSTLGIRKRIYKECKKLDVSKTKEFIEAQQLEEKERKEYERLKAKFESNS